MRCTIIFSMIAALGFGSAFAVPIEGSASIANINVPIARDVAAEAAVAAVAEADNAADRPYGYGYNGYNGYDGGRGHNGDGRGRNGGGRGRGY